MEVVLIFLFIILIAVVLQVRNSLLSRFDRLEEQIRQLKDEKRSPPVQQPAPAKQPAPAHQPAPAQQPTPTSQPISTPQPAAPKQTPHVQPGPVIEAPRPATARQPKPPATEGPGFFDRHPDLEKFIGENLISKIGITVLVLAIGFFVKYAIDNDWIGPAGRVGVGVLCGGILIGIAHWLRNQYKAFSSVLVGGGLATLYFTIALAYHQYQLFGQATAFIIMLVITAFSVLLSLLYDRQELAIIALVGGFVTPFLVSNGKGNYVVLFSYLLILNSGLLVIAYQKAWRLLNILAFGFTALLFASWVLGLPYDAHADTYRGGWIFATIFYLLFFMINIAHTIRLNKPFIVSDFIILLINTCLYFAAGIYLLEQLGLDRYKGLFSAAMGVFNLGATWFLFRRNNVDKNILYLLLGITLSFVSLTAPLQLHGHYITLFWATETVLLYWLFLKSRIKLIRLSSTIVWMAMLVSLVLDWFNQYMAPAWNPIIFNKAFVTGIYVSMACGALFYLRQEPRWAKASLITTVVVLYLVGALEISDQVYYRLYHNTGLVEVYLTGYTWLYFLLFARFSDYPRLTFTHLMSIGLLVAGILLYLFCLPSIFELQSTLLQDHEHSAHFIVHWIGAVIVVLILHKLLVSERSGNIKVEPALFTWLICITVVILLSAEGQLLVNAIFYSKPTDLPKLGRVYNKTGLPILWGLCSFTCMWLGMRHKFKPLRIFSLVLFSITLVKLFLFDIRNIPIAGKIAAFFCLGVLLLVVSFMYQRLKKIITILILVHLTASAIAQGSFSWRGGLDSISKDGFYLIDLPPDLLAKCRADLGDLRILGSDKRFVSYVLKDSRTATDTARTWTAIPGAVMTQKDSSDRHSYLDVEYPAAYEIDYVAFMIRNPVYFKRKLKIEAAGKDPGEWTVVLDTDLDPAKKIFAVPTIKTRKLRIDIANADNVPLMISEVSCLQAPRYLLAWLRSGMTYQVLAGNPQAVAPDYDLKYFTDSLRGTPKELVIYSLQRIGSRDQPEIITPMAGIPKTTAHKDHSPLLLWACLFAVLLFLVYFSLRMVKAIAKKDAHDRI